MRSRLVLLLAALFPAGCQTGTVVRSFGGVEAHGHFINDWAYASYARGVESEARGRHDDALFFYEEAIEQDPESPELWVRLGAMRCRLKLSRAEDAFAEAEDRDPSYEPLWRERAACAARSGETDLALAHIERAVALDPGRDETVLALVALLDRAGRHEDAERWLRSLVARSPNSAAAWQAVVAHAHERNPAWLAVARSELARLAPGIDAPPPALRRKPSGSWRSVDEALIAGSLDDARTRAREGHLDTRLLAARAIFVGRPLLAFEEAELRLGADPDDSDARVALALAADLLGKTATIGEALRDIPAAAERLSEPGRLLLAELLLRHEGTEAAATWLGVEPSALAGDGAPRSRLARAFEKVKA